MLTKARIARHPKYAQILAVYREQFTANGGKVNEKKFWEEHIKPIVPNYSVTAWYQFVERFRKHAGMSASMAVRTVEAGPVTHEEGKLERAMISNDTATQIGIQGSLNVFSEVVKKIFLDPENSGLTKLQLADLGFKAMKAQDSRIKAIGAMKQDNREEAKFNHAFKGAM